MELNAEQSKAAYYEGSKPLLIEAGPGAGKTRVIIERIKFLYNELKVDPASLVVITFTKKAAQELVERLAKENIPQSDIDLMEISTIHSFCYSLLDRDNSVLEVISDDNNERLDLFIRKHLDELGFKGTATLSSKSEIGRIIEKFDEFTVFNVDTEGLVSYIEENYPVSEEFVKLVNESDEFPREEARKSFNDDWYNARYLQIAKAYPTYLKLLEDEGYIDFSSLQRKALDYLDTKPVLPYKNILVDEFQDTDILQFSLFRKLLDNAESFTAVGDIDQSIYGFRGANDDYFDFMLENYDCELVNLNYNYRCSNEIIGLSEEFIKYQRREGSTKNPIPARDVTMPSFYIRSRDKEEEASKIANVVQHLKSKGLVKNYSDIAVLSRSIKTNIPLLVANFQEMGIPYNIRGLEDLLEDDIVKSVLATLFFIIPPSDNPHIMSKWEKDWLNLNALSGANFNYLIHDFSDESKRMLNRVQTRFEEDLLAAEKEVYKEFTGKTSRIKKLSGVFNRDEEILIEIFNRVEKPDISELNFMDESDMMFVDQLLSLRDEISSESYKDRISTLDVFYRILKIAGYFDDSFMENSENRTSINDLALLSQTIYNYETAFYRSDLRGLYWFLTSKLDSYGSSVDEETEDGVAVMTVHKSKGLEFPFVIVSSLSDGKFPSSFKNDAENRYVAGKPTFYTPDEYLKFKDNLEVSEKEELHYLEEDRIIYVAMTRAQDSLILSAVEPVPENVSALIEDNPNIAYLDDFNSIQKVECSDKEDEVQLVNLDFTKLKDYDKCPHRYYLLHDFEFKVSHDEYTYIGIIVHKIFQMINKEIIENDGEISKGHIREIANNILDANHRFSKEDEEKRQDIIDNIESFYDKYGDIEILASETPFNIQDKSNILRGVIDLVYMRDGKLGILEYKNSFYDPKKLDIYKEQLHLYKYALSKNPKFKDYEVEELKVYAAKSKKIIDIPINAEELRKIEDKISKTTENIIKGRFEKTENSENCRDCAFNNSCC